MPSITFPIASQDGHYRQENGSISAAEQSAQKVSIDLDEISGVVNVGFVHHTTPMGKERRDIRTVLMKDGTEVTVAAAGSSSKIAELDKLPSLKIEQLPSTGAQQAAMIHKGLSDVARGKVLAQAGYNAQCVDQQMRGPALAALKAHMAKTVFAATPSPDKQVMTLNAGAGQHIKSVGRKPSLRGITFS